MIYSKDARLNKLAKKLDLNTDSLKNIIVYEHELNNLIPKKNLKEVKIKLALDAQQFINKVAKTLKVSVDAVMGVALINYLENKEEKK